jgi:Zn finger protein HypA/HybF involved in hydrogenase expression
MCSVGGGDFNLDIEEMEVEEFKCKDCGNTFKSIGKEAICPSCQSENVMKL